MKAVVFYEHGGVEVLKYQDIPEPKPIFGEVLVKVKACALNHLDIWVREGITGIQISLPHILGSDISGEVVQVGGGVTNVKARDKVIIAPGLSCGKCIHCLSGEDNLCRHYDIIGYRTDGGYAEYVKVPEVNVIPMPEGMGFEEAAAIPLVFLTAWHMLVTRARIKPGEDVLVLAAGSGVGSASIQIAKLWGARVIATASTDEKLQKAKELGADELINYTTQDMVEEIKRITERRGVDIVVEHVGAATWEKSIQSLARMGRIVTCGATSGPIASVDIRYIFSKHLSIIGSYMGSKGELLQVLKFFKEKKLRAVVDRTLPLREAQKAHTLMEQRQQFGKLILMPE